MGLFNTEPSGLASVAKYRDISGLRPTGEPFALEQRTAAPGKFRVMVADPTTDSGLDCGDKDSLDEAWELASTFHGNEGQDPRVYNDKGEYVDARGNVTPIITV